VFYFFLGYFQSDCTGFRVILLGYFSKITRFFQLFTRFLFSMITLLDLQLMMMMMMMMMI